MKNQIKIAILCTAAIVLLFSCTEEVSQTVDKVASRPSAPILASTVTIGTQVWMAKNLNVSRYRNDDLIPQVTNPFQWVGLTSGAWCYYENNSANGPVYGKLYNWYAVNDPRGLAPAGYHIPTDAEWTTLTTFLGGNVAAGGKMKTTGTLEAGTGTWWGPNLDATNSSGFTCLPSGARYGDGAFEFICQYTYFWSSTAYWTRHLGFNYPSVIREEGPIEEGYSVRCLRDSAFWYLIGSSNRQSEKLQKYIYNTIKNTFGGFLFHMVCLRRFKDKIK